MLNRVNLSGNVLCFSSMWFVTRFVRSALIGSFVLTDWHFGKHFRAYVELKSGLESFRNGGPRPIDEKRLDFEEVCRRRREVSTRTSRAAKDRMAR